MSKIFPPAFQAQRWINRAFALPLQGVDLYVATFPVHDVFITLWEKKSSLLMESAKAYLFSSVRNRCLNHLEQLKVRNKYQEQILQKGDITGLLTWEYYVESELQEHIEKAIRELPPQCQKIFIMNRFNDKSITQIAEELEISPPHGRKTHRSSLEKTPSRIGRLPS